MSPALRNTGEKNVAVRCERCDAAGDDFAPPMLVFEHGSDRWGVELRWSVPVWERIGQVAQIGEDKRTAGEILEELRLEVMGGNVRWWISPVNSHDRARRRSRSRGPEVDYNEVAYQVKRSSAVALGEPAELLRALNRSRKVRLRCRTCARPPADEAKDRLIKLAEDALSRERRWMLI